MSSKQSKDNRVPIKIVKSLEPKKTSDSEPKGLLGDLFDLGVDLAIKAGKFVDDAVTNPFDNIEKVKGRLEKNKITQVEFRNKKQGYIRKLKYYPYDSYDAIKKAKVLLDKSIINGDDCEEIKKISFNKLRSRNLDSLNMGEEIRKINNLKSINAIEGKEYKELIKPYDNELKKIKEEKKKKEEQERIIRKREINRRAEDKKLIIQEEEKRRKRKENKKEGNSNKSLNNPKLVQNVKKWHENGIALHDQGKHEEAIKYYERALKVNPKFVEGLTNKGNSLRLLGKHKDAIKHFDQAIAVNSNVHEPWISKGAAHYDMEQYETAIHCYEEALKIDPLNVMAFSNMGAALANSGDYINALKAFDNALKIDPNDYNAKINKNKLIEKIIRDSTEKGDANRVEGNYREALQHYDEILKIDPKNVHGLINKGAILFHQEKYLDSIKIFDKGIDIDPNHSILLANKGEALEKIGSYYKAIECFKKTIEICSKRASDEKAEKIFDISNKDLIASAKTHINNINKLK